MADFGLHEDFKEFLEGIRDERIVERLEGVDGGSSSIT